MKKKIIWESLHIDEFEDDDEIELVEEDEDFDDGETGSIPIKKLVNTPFGIFKLDDKFNPMRQFELRTGHTNFDITKSVADTISCVDGVEGLMVISRYRFIIGIGKLFNFRDVKNLIETELCENIENDISELISEEIEKVEKLGKYWAIYLLPNLSVETLYSNDESEYLKNIEDLKEAQKLSNGVLVQYSDCNT